MLNTQATSISDISTSRSILTLESARALVGPALMLALGLSVMFTLGCDDDLPEIQPGPEIRIMRDASMRINMLDRGLQELDMGPLAGGQAGSQAGGQAGGQAGEQISGACIQGEVRPSAGCGLERCLNGVWSLEASSRELCNGHDDDCDGRVDETFSLGGMCFIDDERGCRLEGVYECDATSQAARCVAQSTTSTRAETCDGIDNDCDEAVDEGFEDLCCSQNSHCAAGSSCVEGLCVESGTTQPGIDPSAPLGSCGQPVWMPGFGTYLADGNSAAEVLAVANCTGDLLDDLLLTGQTGVGSEVVFAFRPSQDQRVRFSVELSFFAPVIYVFEGSCSPDQPLSDYCDQSILGLLDEPARGAELIFDARAGQLYYVVLDTKLDLLDLLETNGGMSLGSVPFVLTFSAAP